MDVDASGLELPEPVDRPAPAETANDLLTRATAELAFVSRKVDLDQQFLSDPDYTTAPER